MLILNDLNKYLLREKTETVYYKSLIWKDYKLKKTFEERLHESQTIKKKYPDKIPVIINECYDEIRDRVRRKMLLQIDMTVGQFMHSVRTKFTIKPEESVLIFVNNSMPPSTELINNLYEKYKDKDGFLYVTLMKENVFG